MHSIHLSLSAGTLCNYGCFLEDVRRDYDAAETMFKQALASNPRHVGALCNYGTLLQEVRGEYGQVLPALL
jgi:Tfp pilus assembly protein PilF